MNTNPTDTKNSFELLMARLDDERMRVNQCAVTLSALKNELKQLWLPCSFTWNNNIDFDNLSADEDRVCLSVDAAIKPSGCEHNLANEILAAVDKIVGEHEEPKESKHTKIVIDP